MRRGRIQNVPAQALPLKTTFTRHGTVLMKVLSTESGKDRSSLPAHTCDLLDTGQSPHGKLLGVVRLAGVAGSWPDATIPELT